MINTKTTCCVTGGGPAGMMLGLLLARAGIDVTVLEKWPDFFRDFRGDTIHPSTMEVLHQIGLLEKFLALPHNQTKKIAGVIGEHTVEIADFTHLKVHCPFIAFIPQWDFLNFIANEAKQYSNFHLYMHTQATDLIVDNNQKVIGVHAKQNEEDIDIHADLVVAADGRHSTLSEKSGLGSEKMNIGAPMDVLWFHMPRDKNDKVQSFGKIDLGKMLIMIDRGEYWQCGYIIRKNDFDRIKAAGLESFHQDLLSLMPSLTDRVKTLDSWDKVKLLTVAIDRLKKWYQPGLICIGDAAHAMSPIGGVGINLAIQDAVATANMLIPAFKKNAVTENTLQAIQKRRELPTKIIQRIQVFMQNHVVDKVLGNVVHPSLPLPLKLLQHFPILRRIPAKIIGMGYRPEKVE
jgi:2-polyprenyl-6-methoxyphenol hydroxylase-like FAD-dependent oxidoreductase